MHQYETHLSVAPNDGILNCTHPSNGLDSGNVFTNGSSFGHSTFWQACKVNTISYYLNVNADSRSLASCSGVSYGHCEVICLADREIEAAIHPQEAALCIDGEKIVSISFEYTVAEPV